MLFDVDPLVELEEVVVLLLEDGADCPLLDPPFPEPLLELDDELVLLEPDDELLLELEEELLLELEEELESTTMPATLRQRLSPRPSSRCRRSTGPDL